MYIEEGHAGTTTYYTPSTDTVCSQLNPLPSAEQPDKANPPLTHMYICTATLSHGKASSYRGNKKRINVSPNLY